MIWSHGVQLGSRWEPVFHPALFGSYIYAPGEAGMLMKLDRQSGDVVDCLLPFDEMDPNRFVTSPLTVDAEGSVYYTVMKLDGVDPWTQDVKEAFLVKVDESTIAHKAIATSYAGPPR